LSYFKKKKKKVKEKEEEKKRKSFLYFQNSCYAILANNVM